MVGLGRFELPTSPLSGVRSNQLSYRPNVHQAFSSCDQVKFNDALHRSAQTLYYRTPLQTQ